ncbi:MAG: hypothetical protein LBF71_01525 [Campylobacteraceae bacterium]|jgi:hypothetical protein|nr:hypothetical protein [Campylobacteraceae bacterium]
MICKNKRFLLDIHAGSSSADVKEIITSGFTAIQENIKFSGAVFGAKVGTIYEIENIEIEFGIKIDKLSYDEVASKSGSTKTKQTQTDIGLFLGASYKF